MLFSGIPRSNRLLLRYASSKTSPSYRIVIARNPFPLQSVVKMGKAIIESRSVNLSLKAVSAGFLLVDFNQIGRGPMLV